MIDRIEPTRRPPGHPQGYQSWQQLLFLHWRAPAEIVRPVVPVELDLDLYEGQAFVGVVPFRMCDVRPRLCPRRLAMGFLETNVRTYVTYRGRPGVYFLSLDAASPLAVWIARVRWGLPYYLATMSLETDGDECSYASRRGSGGPSLRVSCRIGEALGASRPDTLEFFFLERYLLFVRRGGRILTGQVHHEPYPARAAELLTVEDELMAAAGIDFPRRNPEFVHYAPGVDVSIFPLRS